jgi:hypothetical protein
MIDRGLKYTPFLGFWEVKIFEERATEKNGCFLAEYCSAGNNELCLLASALSFRGRKGGGRSIISS